LLTKKWHGYVIKPAHFYGEWNELLLLRKDILAERPAY
jgi:hypothetical protein